MSSMSYDVMGLIGVRKGGEQVLDGARMIERRDPMKRGSKCST